LAAGNQEVQQSIVLRTGMALAAVILLAVVNMVSSYLTAESTENDAVRINLAGSLRMQTYRIASKFILARTDPGPASDVELQEAIREFEARLEQAVLAEHIHKSGNRVLKQALAQVEDGWGRIKPQLSQAAVSQGQLLENIDSFVAEINGLVKKLELQTESKFRVLRFIQGVSLLLTVCLATVMFLNVYRYVVGPLHQLVNMAAKLRAGDFSTRLDNRGDDELSLLAGTFNDMADSLDSMYRSLEEQVQAKTRHLETTQETLRFLYDTSQRLGAEGSITDKLERTIDHLQRQINAGRIEILLSHESADHPFLITSRDESRALASTSSRVATEPDTDCIEHYALEHDKRNYGWIKLAWPAQARPGREQHQMLSALADTIGAALANESRKDQEHRVALMEERAAMARELHDSIAQSLSFTKIQISRLQTLRGKNAESAQLDEVLAEIKTGIQVAYGQLRELLATFRLQLNSPGLQSSLSATAREFEDKGNLSIELNSTLQNYPLSPNEEIHILHIVREALSNIVRHAGADHAWVNLELESGMFVVRVIDNGCGFVEAATGRNHYGRMIMRERAEILGGTVEFIDRETGGAEVKLQFKPEHACTTTGRAELAASPGTALTAQLP
jgi:two-component system nitrate/nitrite sensor histidine kinase NarX